MAAQNNFLNTTHLLSVKTVKKYAMLNVQRSCIDSTILKTLGVVENVAL